MLHLTNFQWAIVYALRAEPNYRFTGNERDAAERLVARRVLCRRHHGYYRFTKRFTRAYEATLPQQSQWRKAWEYEEDRMFKRLG